MLDRVYMGGSVLLRMGVGLVLLIILARILGPTDYGFIATVFALGALAGLATDFGFTAKTLRDVAAHPEAGAHLVSEALSVKLTLTLTVCLLGGTAILFAPLSANLRLAGAVLGMAVLIGAVGDLALTAYRAVGRYGREFWLTAWTSAAHLGLVVGTAAATSSVLWVCYAYLLSRGLYTGIMLAGLGRLFPGQVLGIHRPSSVLRTMRGAWRWAVDSGLGQVIGQIDGLVVAAVFGLTVAGVYQAAARLVQASLGFVAIFANIHIPRLAILLQTKSSRLARAEIQMAAEFVAVGAAFSLLFWLCGPWLTFWVLGPAYQETNQLWAGFACFVFARYSAAAIGAVLTARDLPLARILGQVGAIFTFTLAIFVYHSSLTIYHIPFIMSTSSLATLCILFVALIAIKRSSRDEKAA